MSDAEAIRLGHENMALGTDAVYTGASLGRVRALARERIPVVGPDHAARYRERKGNVRAFLGATRELVESSLAEHQV